MIPDAHDDVLFIVSERLSEQIEAAYVAGIRFVADAEFDKRPRFGEHLPGCEIRCFLAVQKTAFLIDLEHHQITVLTLPALPDRRVQPAVEGTVIARAGPGGALDAIDPECHVRLPVLAVPRRLRTEFHRKAHTADGIADPQRSAESVRHASARGPQNPGALSFRKIKAVHPVFHPDRALRCTETAGRIRIDGDIAAHRHLHAVRLVHIAVSSDKLDICEIRNTAAHLRDTVAARLLLHPDKSRLLKDLQMKGDGGLGNFERPGNVADNHVVMGDQLKNPDPVRRGKRSAQCTDRFRIRVDEIIADFCHAIPSLSADCLSADVLTVPRIRLHGKPLLQPELRRLSCRRPHDGIRKQPYVSNPPGCGYKIRINSFLLNARALHRSLSPASRRSCLPQAGQAHRRKRTGGNC